MYAETVPGSSAFPQPAQRMSGIKSVAIHARVPMRGYGANAGPRQPRRSVRLQPDLSLQILREERQHLLFDALDDAIRMIAVVDFEGMRDAEVGENLIHLQVRRSQ